MDALDALLPKNSSERKTLADIIFAKLESGETSGAAVIQKSRQSQHLRYYISLRLNLFAGQTVNTLIHLLASIPRLSKRTQSSPPLIFSRVFALINFR